MKKTLMFTLRLLTLSLPLIISHLTNTGSVEWAGLLSAILVITDKAVHESKLNATGIIPF